jgi:pimeloyl-ACP methyl ester carboxylesterase
MMPEITRNDVTISYDDEGAGAAVLLIHGHTLDRRVFAEVAAALRDRGLRTLVPDLRGHGRSSRPDKGYHFSHHADDMAAVLDAAAVDAAAVVGFSLGGGIALEMAVTMPERVRSLALVAPVMPDRPFEAAFMDNLKQVARTARADGIRAAMEGPWLESPLFAVSFSKAGVRERTAEIVRDFPGADYLATERDRVERDWTVPGRLGEIRVPTLVVVGEAELPGFRAYADEAARGIPGARLEVVAGCGHLLPLEARELLAEEVVRHLEAGN